MRMGQIERNTRETRISLSWIWTEREGMKALVAWDFLTI